MSTAIADIDRILAQDEQSPPPLTDTIRQIDGLLESGPTDREFKVQDRFLKSGVHLMARRDERWPKQAGEIDPIEAATIGKSFAARFAGEKRREKDQLTRLQILNEYEERAGLPLSTEVPIVEAKDVPFFTEDLVIGVKDFKDVNSFRILLGIADRIKKGTETIDDWEYLADYQEKLLHEETERTFMAGAMEIAAESIPFMQGFGLTKAALKLGTTALSKASRKVLGDIVQDSIERRIKRYASKIPGSKLVPTAALQTEMLDRFTYAVDSRTLQRMLPSGIALPSSDKEKGGSLPFEFHILNKGEDYETARRNAKADIFAEVWGEGTGETASKVIGFVTGPIRRKIGARPTAIWARDMLEKVGYHGWGTEIIEEDLSKALREAMTRITAGTDMEINMPQELTTLREYGQMGLAFAPPAMAGRVLGGGQAPDISEEQLAELREALEREGVAMEDLEGALDPGEIQRPPAPSMGISERGWDSLIESYEGRKERGQKTPSPNMKEWREAGLEGDMPNTRTRVDLIEEEIRRREAVRETIPQEEVGLPETRVQQQVGAEEGGADLEVEEGGETTTIERPEGVTQHEHLRRIQQEDVPEGSWDVEHADRGRAEEVQGKLQYTHDNAKFGGAVDVKPVEFFQDPENKVFITPDGNAGATVTKDGDLVAGFRVPGTNANFDAVMHEASKHARTLDAMDTHGVLPNKYGKHGFRPVARVRWNPKYKPDNWPEGEIADQVLMVRDIDGPTGLPEVNTDNYNEIKDSVPIFDTWEEAVAERNRQLEKLDAVVKESIEKQEQTKGQQARQQFKDDLGDIFSFWKATKKEVKLKQVIVPVDPDNLAEWKRLLGKAARSALAAGIESAKEFFDAIADVIGRKIAIPNRKEIERAWEREGITPRTQVEDTVAQRGEGKAVSSEKQFFNMWIRWLKKAGGMVEGYTKSGKISMKAVRKAAANAVADLVRSGWLRSNPIFGDYYSKDIARAREIAARVFPELKDDGLWGVFLMHNAIASNNTNLPTNTKEVVELWRWLRNHVYEYKETTSKKAVGGQTTMGINFTMTPRKNLSMTTGQNQENWIVVPGDQLGKDNGKFYLVPTRWKSQEERDNDKVAEPKPPSVSIPEAAKAMERGKEFPSFDSAAEAEEFRDGASPFMMSGATSVSKARFHVVLAQSLAEHNYDPAATTAYWLESVSMDEIKKMRRPFGFISPVKVGVTQEVVRAATGQDKAIPRSFFFGPKLGAYMRNLQGDMRYTTVDVWEARLAKSYFKGLFKEGDLNSTKIPQESIEMELILKWGEEVNKILGVPPASGQAMRWFYIIDRIGKAGYTKAITSETISTYIERALAQGTADVERGGAGEEGVGAAPERTDAEPRTDGTRIPTSSREGLQRLRKAREEFKGEDRGVAGRQATQNSWEEWVEAKENLVKWAMTSLGTPGVMMGNADEGIRRLAIAAQKYLKYQLTKKFPNFWNSIKDDIPEEDRAEAEKLARIAWNKAVDEDALGPDAQGLPADKVSEEKKSPDTDLYPDSIKNEVSAEDRAAHGLPERRTPGRQPLPDLVEEGEWIIQNDPRTAQAMIEELDKDPMSSANPVSVVILLHRKMQLKKEHRQKVRELDDAQRSGDAARIAIAENAEQAVRDELLRIIDIAERSGTMVARTLGARRIYVDEDFGLVEALTYARKARGVSHLSQEDTELIKDLHARLERAKEQREKLEQKIAEMASKEQHQEVVKAVAKEEKAAPVRKAAPKKRDVKQAWGKLKSHIPTTGKGLVSANPFLSAEFYKDAFDLAVALAEAGYKTVKRFLKDAKEELGEENFKQAEPVLRKAWAEATKDMKPEAGDTVESNAEMSKYAKALQRYYVEQGMKDRDNVINAVWEDLKQVAPGFTKRQTMDAISGYGDYQELSKDEVEVIIRDQRGIMREIAKLEDMEAGIPPWRSGKEQHMPTEEHRRFIARVNNQKKLGGYKVTDPERQLRTALDAVKTRLNNQIRDLEYQINSNPPRRIVKNRVELIPDDEVIELRKRRDELRSQFKAIFGRKELTDEQRVAIAKKAALRSIAEYERRIREKDYSPRTRTTKTPKTAELKALYAQRDALRAELDELSYPTRALAAYKRRVASRIAMYEERMANEDFAPKKKTKREYKLDREAEALRYKEESTLKEYYEKLAEWERENRTKPQVVIDWTKEGAHFSRALLTSMDVSAVGRQGGIVVASHPIMGMKATKDMMIAARSEAGASRIRNEIANDSDYALAMRADLQLTSSDGKPNEQEEKFIGRLASKTPGIAASERAYITYLNRVRMDLFKHMIRNLGKGGTVTEAEAKVIANYVNVATGRGKLDRRMRGAAEWLSTVFFAPRYVMSRFQYILGQPLRTGMTTKELGWKNTKRARMLIAKEYARMAAGTGAFVSSMYMSLLLTMGPPGEDEEWDFETDPRSTDFMKFRIDNHRIDPLYGLSQAVVLFGNITPFVGGKKSLMSGDVYPTTRDVPYGKKNAFQLAMDFGRKKLAPVPGHLVSFMVGETVVGEEFTVGHFLENSLIPISLGDVIKGHHWREHGPFGGTALLGFELIGISVQYHDQERIRKREEEEGRTLGSKMKRFATKPSKALGETYADKRRRVRIYAQRNKLSKGEAIAALRSEYKVKSVRKNGKLTPYGEARRRLLMYWTKPSG